jgi:ribonuclease Z
MGMKIVFLGTSGSIPTPLRGSSSVVVKKGRDLVMFDCGEGTLRQMVKAKIGFRRNMHILLTHLHGDHLLGLPGLIQSMSLLGRERQLNIYGPPGITNFIKSFTDFLGGPKFTVIINEIREPGIVYNNNQFKLIAAKADHGIMAYSYAFVELPRPGRFYPDKAKALCVPKGKLWHKLQHGETVTVKNKKIQSSQVTDPQRSGRKIVYSGDTRPNNNLLEISKEADLLIHESTFSEELTERAWNDGHSTTTQAANIALSARVSKLVLTHFSSRYYNSADLCKEARKIFPSTIIADDFLELKIPYRD